MDFVLRIKLGAAKAKGIKIKTTLRISKQMGLGYGDIGVLCGNLLDNAAEVCWVHGRGRREGRQQ